MKLLLDTHALLWWLHEPDKLSPRARTVVADPENRVWVSAASAWEVATKHRLGKIPSAAVFLSDVEGWVVRAGFTPLPITLGHAQRAGAFPSPHRDPFDRMIAAQAILEHMTVVGKDAQVADLGATLIW